MTVYVDDLRIRYGRMVMCHMIADSEAELHAMASLIGVARRWYQGDHYDVCLASREVAVRYGAMEIGRRVCAAMRRRSVVEGAPGAPEEAVAWWRDWMAGQRAVDKPH